MIARRALASVLANEFSEASGRLHVAALLEIGFLLLLLTILVNGLARWLVWRVRRSGGRGGTRRR